jgi:hypothetical protein
VTSPQGVIVPINTAAVMAHILDLAERLEAKALTFRHDSHDYRGACEGALATRVVLLFLAEVFTSAHLASMPQGDRQ